MTATVAPPAKDWKNLFGVCACLGEDFGFNPIWLRLAFGAALIWSPVAVISAYFALGAIVLLSRVMVRPRRVAQAPAVTVTPTVAENENVALPLAA